MRYCHRCRKMTVHWRETTSERYTDLRLWLVWLIELIDQPWWCRRCTRELRG